MRYFLPFLILSLLFSQELEVEGNLKVTGTVESTTIDSLEQVIANMQAQIDSMQSGNRLVTRLFIIESFEIPDFDNPYYLDIRTLLSEYNLDKIVISYFSFEHSGSGAFEFKIETFNPNTNETGDYIYVEDKEDFNGTIRTGGIIPFDLDSEKELKVSTIVATIGSPPFYGTLQLAVTAQFPD